jgi:hypothetical protein
MEFDQDDEKKKLNELFHSVGGVNIPASNYLAAAGNAYRNLRVADAPTITSGGIQVVRDSRSPLVQAADVLGNFALSWLFTKLGDVSKKRIERAKAFEAVFRDTMNSFDPQAHLVQEGNDLRLRNEGQVRLRIHWVRD